MYGFIRNEFLTMKIKSLRFNKLLRILHKTIMRFADGIVLLFIKKHSGKSTYKKILIIRNDVLGDIIVSLPAIKSLKQQYPEAELDILVRPQYVNLLTDCRYIDRVLSNADNLDSNYDLAIAMTPSKEANCLLLRSGAKHRIGYAGFGGVLALTEPYWDDRETRPRHEIETNIEIVKKAGVTESRAYIDLVLPEASEIYANNFIKSNDLEKQDFIIIHPGASRAYLRWPLEKYIQLANEILSKTELKIVFSLGPGEERYAELIEQKLSSRIIACLNCSIEELAGVYRNAIMYIGNVTGPMHLAVALKKKILAITAMKNNIDDMRYWGPLGVKFSCIYPEGDYKGGHPSDIDGVNIISSISVNVVFEEFLNLYEEDINS